MNYLIGALLAGSVLINAAITAFNVRLQNEALERIEQYEVNNVHLNEALELTRTHVSNVGRVVLEGMQNVLDRVAPLLAEHDEVENDEAETESLNNVE